jgi:MFS family permease
MSAGATVRDDGALSASAGRAQRDAKLRAAFWGVMASFIVHGLVASTWVSRIHSIKSELSLSDAALGMALLGTAIGSIVAIPVCGSLVTKYGSRRIVAATGAGFCAALLLPGLATGPATLFAALVFYGAMAGSNDVAMNAQAVATEKVLGVPAMSRFHAMFSLGGIIGAAGGGLIASRGISPSMHFAFSAAAFVPIALLAPRLMLDTSAGPSQHAAGRWRHVPVTLIALSAIGFCMFLSEGAIADWAGVYLHEALHSTEGFAPAGYAVFSAAMAIFRFAGDAITARIGRRSVIRYGGCVAAAGVALALCVSSPYWALAGFAAAGIGFSSIVPNVFGAAGAVPEVSEGAGVATVSGVGYLGFLVGPPAIGFVSEVSSLRGGLCLLVFLCVAGAMLAGVGTTRGRPAGSRHR